MLYFYYILHSCPPSVGQPEALNADERRGRREENILAFYIYVALLTDDSLVSPSGWKTNESALLSVKPPDCFYLL